MKGQEPKAYKSLGPVKETSPGVLHIDMPTYAPPPEKFRHRGAESPWVPKGGHCKAAAAAPETPDPPKIPTAKGWGYDGSKGYALGKDAPNRGYRTV